MNFKKKYGFVCNFKKIRVYLPKIFIMKKITLLLAFIGISMMSFSQMDLRFGMQITGNWNWLLNKQVTADGPCQDPKGTTFGEYFGPFVNFHPIPLFGIEFGFNYGMMQMKYMGNIPIVGQTEKKEINHYESSIKYKYFDLPLVFQVGKEVYFEAGMLFHFRHKVIYNRDYDNDAPEYRKGEYANLVPEYNPIDCIDLKNVDVTEPFKKFGFGLLIGVGGNIPITDYLLINIGLRANYILTDMKGVNGLNLTKEHFETTSNDYAVFKTYPMYFGVRLGVIYKLNLSK
jgi:hypothetical protein